jgi:hypothetical protein
MINIFKRNKRKLVAENGTSKNKYLKYILNALGEIFLVMVGILLALQVNNWNQKRVNRTIQMETLENFYISSNEGIQLQDIIEMMEFALEGEKLWSAYLDGHVAFHDSLLRYAYFIGATAQFSPNSGFYESLKLRGLETMKNSSLRNQTSIIHEQVFPQLREALNNFEDRFGQDRIRLFRKYFVLGETMNEPKWDIHYRFDYAMYRVKDIHQTDQLRNDEAFRDLVKVSLHFHENTLIHLRRAMFQLSKVNFLGVQEFNRLKYGNIRNRRIAFQLEGYTDAEIVYLVGDFNNWRNENPMRRTKTGWTLDMNVLPGIYEYKFLVAGTGYILDTANSDSVHVPEVNSYNSVIFVRPQENNANN